MFSFSRIAHYNIPKMGFNYLLSFMSTATKYVVYQGGQVFTGTPREITKIITIKFKEISSDGKILNIPVHQALFQELHEMKNRYPDAVSVTGIIRGDGYETTYHISEKVVGECDNSVGSGSN